MKKFLLLLGMVACIFGTAACGQEQTAKESQMQVDEASLISYADQLIDALNQVVASGMQDQYSSDAVISAGLTSWETALPDLGDYLGITAHEVEVGTDEAVVDVTVDGSEHDVIVTLVVDGNGQLTSVTANVVRSMGELMINAALNTLMGMGTVFIVLIIISLLISCFRFIPQLQKKLSGKKEAAVKEAAPAASAAAPEAISAQEPESSDEELIAVIAAAIAASEGRADTDGFVVRSIRRRGSAWKKA
ncbi:MAG: OadG family transporter subunit [Eubacteriales bacterium]|nr:OadG family transporter subunit [Eubacteriales bacterium]